MLDNENVHLSVKDIAKKLGYSEEHLIRTFKKFRKETPSKVFTKIKLDYAGELLIATDYPVSYVCDLIGYYSQHYFNKIFKEHFGCSPSSYRKKNFIPF
jgi:AraC-like DNA-binding protein